jgi:uncharacterized protein (DUF2249 family)
MSITYAPELLPKPEPGDEVEIIVDHHPTHPQARVYRMSITYAPELLPKPEPGDEVEIIVDHHDWR